MPKILPGIFVLCYSFLHVLYNLQQSYKVYTKVKGHKLKKLSVLKNEFENIPKIQNYLLVSFCPSCGMCGLEDVSQ